MATLYGTQVAGATIKKHWSFARQMATGETIASVTSITADTPTGATALTISGITFSGAIAEAVVLSPVGSGGYTFHITVIVVTTDGNTRKECMNLAVLVC